MKITFEGSKSEIVDFILLLQNRRVQRVPYSNESKCATVAPEGLIKRSKDMITPLDPAQHK